jgi:hypothetical protein
MPLVAPPADEEVGTTTTTARESGKTSAFLSNDNLCGRTLLELVGRGHSILADIKILSERVPPAILVAANLDGKAADAKSSASEEKGGFLNIFGQTSAAKSSAKPNNPSSNRKTKSSKTKKKNKNQDLQNKKWSDKILTQTKITSSHKESKPEH